MNGVVKAARHLEDFRPFDGPPPPPPPFPQFPFDSPGIPPGKRSLKGASPVPKPRPNVDVERFARPVGPSPRVRDQEIQRRGNRDVRRRDRSPEYDDDSAYESEESYHSPRERRTASSRSSDGPGSGGSRKKSSGPGSSKSSGDPAARRKDLEQFQKQNEPPGLLKKLEEVVTPLRVGILLGCFDLVGGSLTIWMTRRRAAKEKEAEAEKLAMAAQAAEGANEEPVAPRGGERTKKGGGSSGSSASRRSGRRRRDYSDSETESESDDYNRAAKGQAPGGGRQQAHGHAHRGRR